MLEIMGKSDKDTSPLVDLSAGRETALDEISKCEDRSNQTIEQYAGSER